MYGLVLEGGGGRGAYQIGACRAIRELGAEISMVAGTSVGALNGAMIVQDDLDKAYDIWHDIDTSSVLDMTGETLKEYIGNTLKTSSLKLLLRELKKILKEGGLDVGPLEKLVKNAVDEEKVRKSPIGFGIVTVDITNRRALEIYKEQIPRGQLADYVIASASYPFFKRTVIDGCSYIDGALYNVLPVNMVSGRGYNDIIVIRTYGTGMRRRINTAELNIISIAPEESLGSTMDFSTENSRRNLKLGYFDAHKKFRRLKGKKYYILPMEDDRFFINYLGNMSDEKIKRLCGLFGFNEYGMRLLFEEIVPRTGKLLGLPSGSSYEDIAAGLLEKAADGCGIDRFRFYTVEELYKILLEKRMTSNGEFVKESPGYLRNLELLSGAARDKMIAGLANELFTNEEKK